MNGQEQQMGASQATCFYEHGLYAVLFSDATRPKLRRRVERKGYRGVLKHRYGCGVEFILASAKQGTLHGWLTTSCLGLCSG